MKESKFFLIICMMLLNYGCHAQSNMQDKQVIAMLSEFYKAYNSIWAIKPPPHPKELYSKLDSIQEKYCSQKLRKEAKEWFEDGHDLLTNDWGISAESLNTMTIDRDLTKVNAYVITYITNAFPVSPDVPVKQKVILYVTVVKEGDFKIDSVTAAT